MYFVGLVYVEFISFEDGEMVRLLELFYVDFIFSRGVVIEV